MNIRQLAKEELELLRDIDRREVVEEVYYVQDGKLKLRKEFFEGTEHPWSGFEEYIERLRRDADAGGSAFGAFDGDVIAGMAAIQGVWMGTHKDTLLMDILYVSRDYRGCGIGKILVERTKEKAKSMGAAKLYISATPSKNTVDFYLRCGGRLAVEIDAELFAKEPLDIHIEMAL